MNKGLPIEKKVLVILGVVLLLILLRFIYGFPEIIGWISLTGLFLSCIGLILIETSRSKTKEIKISYAWLLIVFFILLFVTYLHLLLAIIAVTFALVAVKALENEHEDHVRLDRT